MEKSPLGNRGPLEVELIGGKFVVTFGLNGLYSKIKPESPEITRPLTSRDLPDEV